CCASFSPSTIRAACIFLLNMLCALLHPAHNFVFQEVTDLSCGTAMLFVYAIGRHVLTALLTNLACVHNNLVVGVFLGYPLSDGNWNWAHWFHSSCTRSANACTPASARIAPS